MRYYVLNAAADSILDMSEGLFPGIAPGIAGGKNGDCSIPSPILVLTQLYLEYVGLHLLAPIIALR